MKSPTILQWEKVRQSPTEVYRKYFEIEKKFLISNTPKNSVLLDIGSGSGEYISEISKISKEIIAIDNDEDAIKMFKTNNKKFINVNIIFADAEKIPFNESYFDVVICMGTTFGNFGGTKPKVLAEIKRVLKNKGAFILSVYNENALRDRLIIYKKYWKDIDNKGKGNVIINGVLSEQFSKQEITDILNNAGFKIIEMKKGKIFYLIKAVKKI